MDLKRLATIGVILSSALVLSACNKLNYSQNKQPQQASTSSSTTQVADEITVSFSDGGVIASPTIVKSGGRIVWTNNSKNKVSVASDPHPTHTANPELTNGQSVIDLAPGASVAAVVTKAGTWGFHDHLNPSVKGKLTVQ